MTASQYEVLVATSDPIHPLFRLALIVVHETGHRIGAVRLLRWADIDHERQLVRWRAENDKIGYEHETWLTPTAVEALQNCTPIAAGHQRVGVPGAVEPGKADFAAPGPGLVAARTGAGQAADRAGAGLV